MQATEFSKYFQNYPLLNRQFAGVFAIDTLPKSLKLRKFCICNTDVSSGIGKHWFVLLRSSKTTLECFDSLGITAEKTLVLKKYCELKGISEIVYNETQFQDNLSNTCGLFVIYFIFERMHNLDMTFPDLLEEIFDGENLTINEENTRTFCDNLLINK